MTDLIEEAIKAAAKAIQVGWVVPLGEQWPRQMAHTAVAAAAPHIAAAERQRIRQRLTAHYLADIICDHQAKRDKPACACSLIDLGWHPTVGAAVGAWIDHLLTEGTTT